MEQIGIIIRNSQVDLKEFKMPKKNEGFVLKFSSRIVDAHQYLSLVERWKKLGLKLLLKRKPSATSSEIRGNANEWIDYFILIKWIYVTILFLLSVNQIFCVLFAVYLLYYNLFSYFYYHGWGSSFAPPKLSPTDAIERDRRRLVSFLLAFFYSIYGFAYLYLEVIPGRLEWPMGPNFLDAIYLSISNSFTLTYNGFQPKDQLARGLLLLQLMNVFVFLTILIGNAVPNVGRSSQ